jgi:hypothetical protein
LSLPYISIKQQTFIGLLVFVLGLLLARQFGEWIIGGDLNQVAFVFAAAAAAGVGLAVLRNWRSGTYLFLTWLIFEDLIRKYLGNNMALYFAKDALAGVIYVALYLAARRHPEKWPRPHFLLAFGVFFWFAVLQVFNPNSPNPLYGLLGLKLYFFYVPLMFVGYALVSTDQHLERFLVLFSLLAAAVAGLGITQSIVGTNFLSPATLAPDIRELGNLEKYTPISHELFNLPPSVFVSAGRYGQFLFLCVVLGLGSAGYSVLKGGRGRRALFLSLGIIAVGVLLCGSRGTLVLGLASAAVMSTAFLWGAPKHKRRLYRKLTAKAIRRSAVVAVMFVATAVLVFPKQIGTRWDFYSETLSPTSSAYELSYRMWDYPLANVKAAFSEQHWVMGNGTGTSSLGAQYVAELLHKPRPALDVESGYGGLDVEMGIVGLVLWLIWTSLLVISCWRIVRRLRQTHLFPIGFAVFWYAAILLFPQTFGSLNSYQDYAANAFLWLLVGVLYRLPELAVAPPGQLVSVNTP